MGGPPPVDPKSELDDFQTDFTRRFAKDKIAQQALANTNRLSDVNTENFAAVQLTSVVPFLLEDELTDRGADFQKVADWHPLAIRDGLIFTGQNPASSEVVAEKLLDYLA